MGTTFWGTWLESSCSKAFAASRERPWHMPHFTHMVWTPRYTRKAIRSEATRAGSGCIVDEFRKVCQVNSIQCRNLHCVFIPCLLCMIFTRACSCPVSERGTAQNWDVCPKADDWKTPNSSKSMAVIGQVFLLWTRSPSLLGIQDNYEFGDISRSLLRTLADLQQQLFYFHILGSPPVHDSGDHSGGKFNAKHCAIMCWLWLSVCHVEWLSRMNLQQLKHDNSRGLGLPTTRRLLDQRFLKVECWGFWKVEMNSIDFLCTFWSIMGILYDEQCI